MDIKCQIDRDMKMFMQIKLKTEVTGIRMLKAAIKNKEIDLRKELDNAQIITIVKKQIKEHEQSLSYLKEPQHHDEIEKYQTYIHVLKSYLPEEMDENEARIIIIEELSKANITAKSQMGQAMKLLKEKLAGQIDNSKISKIVKEFLI